MNRDEEMFKINRTRSSGKFTIALVIAFSGILILSAVLYVIIFFPPPTFKPLRTRILTYNLLEKTEKGLTSSEIMIVVEALEQGVSVYEEPIEGAQEIKRVFDGERYSLLEIQEEWVKIKLGEDIMGWLLIDYVIKE